MESRQSIQGIIEAIDQHNHKDAALMTLKRLLGDAREVQVSPPPGVARSEMRPFDEAIGRLEAWIGYVMARDEFALEVSGDESTDIAIELIQLPDLQRIEQALDVVKSDATVQQAAQQANFALRLKKLKTNDQKAKKALERTKALLERLQPLQVEELRDLHYQLQQHLRKPSTLRHQLLDSYNDVRGQLMRKVSLRLRELILLDNHYYQKLPLAETKILVEELRRV